MHKFIKLLKITIHSYSRLIQTKWRNDWFTKRKMNILVWNTLVKILCKAIPCCGVRRKREREGCDDWQKCYRRETFEVRYHQAVLWKYIPKKKKKFICATQCVFFNLPSKLIIALWIKVFINCLNYPFYQMSPISLVKNCVFFLYLLSLLSQYHTLSFDLVYCRLSGNPFSWEWT